MTLNTQHIQECKRFHCINHIYTFGNKTEEKQVEKNLYHIATRNEMTGKIEVNTLL